MRREIGITLSVAHGLALIAATALPAQFRPALTAGTGYGRWLGDASMVGMLLRPEAAWSLSNFTLDANGELSWPEDAAWAGDASLRMSWHTGDRIGASFGTALRRLDRAASEARATAYITGRLETRGERFQTWGQGAIGRSVRGHEWRPAASIAAGSSLPLRGGRLRFEATTTFYRDGITTLPENDGRAGLASFTDTSTSIQSASSPLVLREASRVYTDAVLGYAWLKAPLALDLALAARVHSNGGRDAWMNGSLVYSLTSTSSLVLNAGVAPSLPELGAPRSRFAVIALRFETPRTRMLEPITGSTAKTFVAREIGGGLHMLSVGAADATTVEIQGDFTDWRPVALEPAERGRWQIAMHLTPGTYRINMRVNGERWTVPPGLAAIRDEFDGVVGVLVVK